MSGSAAESRRRVTDAVLDRLRALPHGGSTMPGLGPRVSVYDIEVSDRPPHDESRRVLPYAVMYPAGSRSDVGGSMGRTPAAHRGSTLLWSAQLTFAAGYRADLEHTVDRMLPWLTGWAPAVPGLRCGPVQMNPNVDGTGPIRLDRDVAPPRFYVAVPIVCHVGGTTTT